jgi:hypothetical protein
MSGIVTSLCDGAQAEQNARLRDLTVEASEVLRLPMPDTFLGRKTQESFPKQPP